MCRSESEVGYNDVSRDVSMDSLRAGADKMLAPRPHRRLGISSARAISRLLKGVTTKQLMRAEVPGKKLSQKTVNDILGYTKTKANIIPQPELDI